MNQIKLKIQESVVEPEILPEKSTLKQKSSIEWTEDTGNPDTTEVKSYDLGNLNENQSNNSSEKPEKINISSEKDAKELTAETSGDIDSMNKLINSLQKSVTLSKVVRADYEKKKLEYELSKTSNDTADLCSISSRNSERQKARKNRKLKKNKHKVNFQI